jgi:hypothetical protein
MIAVDIAANKPRQNTPAIWVFRFRRAIAYAASTSLKERRSPGYPVVIKPLDGNHGKGPASDNDIEHARIAFDRARVLTLDHR